jgi:asparagine synthase (glutamine-hydrolysing)
MCGIVGVYNFNKESVSESALFDANECLIHRGPDAGNIFIHKNVGLAHRRLSIIDLSENGSQPMSSSDGRYTIAFNGEIYNFIELRKQLVEEFDIVFSSESDTEVVLNAFIAWNDDSFRRLNGMFALAIFDQLENKIVLARDRYGIKPLYYTNYNNTFVFASEIVAIKSYLGESFKYNIKEQALVEYAWFGNPLGENTFFENVKEVLPGRTFKLTENGLEITRFWEPSQIEDNLHISEKDVIKRVRNLMEESVKRHLISDVPVGIFLSGGIDSSVITALSSEFYTGKIKTYSVGFDFDKGINELPKAKMLAERFGTDHHEVYVEAKNLPDVIERLVDAHGEPFADAADIPLYLLTNQVKREVKVVLQGDGGDEIFGGYSRYFTLTKQDYFRPWKLLSGLPWQMISNTALLQKVRFLDAITTDNDADRLALLLTMESKRHLPTKIFSHAVNNRLKNLNPFKRYHELNNEFKNKDLIQRLFNIDLSCILPDTFLEKVDKSTMANGVEIRVPFLDNDLVEFALSIPSSLKVKNGVKKYLLKKAFEDLIPHDILYGPKTGFGVPYSFWIQKSLLDYLKSNINDPKVIASGIFNYQLINDYIEKHHNGKGNYGFLLWKCLILAIWIRKQPSMILDFKL